MKELKKISIDKKIMIFNEVFNTLIEHISYRTKLLGVLNAKQESEMADLEIKLLKLELEILKNKGGESNG